MTPLLQILAAKTIEIATKDSDPDSIVDLIGTGFIIPLIHASRACGPHMRTATWKVVIESKNSRPACIRVGTRRFLNPTGNHGYTETGVFAAAFKKYAPQENNVVFTRHTDNPNCKIGLNTTNPLKVNHALGIT